MPWILEPRTRALSVTRLGALRAHWPTAVIAVLLFLTAYDKGAFGLSARSTLAIDAVWALLLACGLGVWPRVRAPRAGLVVAGLLVAFAIWTFASLFWAASAENAVTEFNRVTLYIALFLIAMCAGTRATVRYWASGLATGITAIAIVALVSRLFPSTFSLQGLPMFLPGAVTRLSFPVGYWNGLAIFVAFAYPLWLGVATKAGRWWQQAGAVMPFPFLAAVIYLTSSRGGVAAALVGTLVFLMTTARRWAALGTSVVAAAGSAAAIAVLLPRHELVDGPIRSHQAAGQGHVAFLLILVLSVGAGAVYALGRWAFRRVTPSRASGWALVAVLAAGSLAGVVASHPSKRFESFKEFPAMSGQTDATVRSHLLSGSGSGRWQFWTAAIHEWESAPIVGRGAGSYQAWWAEHAPFTYFVRNAHSLYLEVLGELGLVGFLLLATALVYGGVVATKNALRRTGEERVVASSLLGVLGAFYLGAGIEWIWQLPAVTGAGIVCLGLLTGPAGTLEAPRPVPGDARPMSRRVPRFAIGVAALAIGWFVLCVQAIPWLADLQLNASAAAVGRSDGPSAFRHALNAKSIQPWAASPYLQLALVDEQRGDLTAARLWIAKAIHRDSIDWRLWLVAARLETKHSDLAAARRSLLRAESLNPRSPLFGHGA
jgi:O-Antigen ligase